MFQTRSNIMVGGSAVGQKRPRSYTPVSDEPQTPAKRVAYEPKTPSSSLTPKQRSKRMQAIKAGLAAASITPTKRGERASSGLSGRSAGSLKPTIDRGPYYPPFNDHFGSVNERLPDARSASSSTAAKTLQDEIDSEEEFWTSPPRPVARLPRGEFSAAGYRPGNASKSEYARNAMLTPPQSSPVRDTHLDSPSSSFQVSELLQEDPDPQESSGSALNGHAGIFKSDSENPFDVRASPARGQSDDYVISSGMQHKTVREHLAALSILPDQIEKLERKQRTAEQSAHKKQERIHELEIQVRDLEAQVMQLDKKCSNQEAVIQHLKTLIRAESASAL
ncbi:uncharacterized protein PHACADRAFT_258248 [Phanerochaete carnosa HHB-10118-sp]|uniref:Uncharacterized protein n=1 Tax=Phanerochaete carnosa (strain HHB-10118-sp) TaxID=650164 RepID=K5UWK1_PHACS|nr:uncharacterized protein PHACADRAFT_258248 [Phanerochaete carnosa HHB-10118-sp]EKM54416.1 hypothetical protein PHACADRAFT_258248 [Phanerochaete carnosa HHB-10118-sp]